MSSWPWTTYVYRAFDERERLLYVGITADLRMRMVAHVGSVSSSWLDDCTRLEVEQYPTRLEAERAELEAIWHEAPLWNRHGQPDYRRSASSELRTRALDRYAQLTARERRDRVAVLEERIDRMLNEATQRRREPA